MNRRIIAGPQAKLTTAPNWPAELDKFALTACQQYNLGNAGNWFFSFRGGYYGVMSRLRGLQRHSLSLHQWRMDSSVQTHEHDITVMLFCMDSAIECFVFMLNALGQAADKDAFRDVSSERTLQRINPDDVLGAKRAPLAGYAKYFPHSKPRGKARRTSLLRSSKTTMSRSIGNRQASVGWAALILPLAFMQVWESPKIRFRRGSTGRFIRCERF